MAEYSKYVELIQSIGLSKFGVSASKGNNIVITKDKILASYNSYGPALNDSYPKENLGIDELEDTIKEMFFQGEIKINDEVMLTNLRQKSAVKEALDSLLMVKIKYKKYDYFFHKK